MTRSRRRALRLGRSGRLALPSRIDLAAAEHDLLAVDGVVLLDLDHELGVGQADAVAGGRAVLGRRRRLGRSSRSCVTSVLAGVRGLAGVAEALPRRIRSIAARATAGSSSLPSTSPQQP